MITTITLEVLESFTYKHGIYNLVYSKGERVQTTYLNKFYQELIEDGKMKIVEESQSKYIN